MTESWASTPASRAVMRANRRCDTRPELALRSAVYARGLRYRVNIRPIKELRRTADLVFTRTKVAVFLDGCFWHGCPDHYRPAKGATSAFWHEKIASNMRRDASTDELLQEAGWETIRIWEHQSTELAADQIVEVVASRKRR
jgi:DNA mismatch endonuclease (patch repair protein)